MISVDPFGVTHSCVAHTMGRGNDESNKLLSSKWKNDMNEREVIELCLGIFCKVAKKEIGVN